MRVDENGNIIRKDWRYIETYPPSVFLKDAVKDYKTSVPDPSYHDSIRYQMSKYYLTKRFDLLNLHYYLSGNVYEIYGEGAYGTKKLQQLVFDKDLTSKQLDLKLRQWLEIYGNINPNIICDFIRKKMGLSAFANDKKPISYIKFNLKYQDGRVKSGYIFAYNDQQFMRGTDIKDGTYDINYNDELYIKYEPEIVDGKTTTYHAERKIIIALEDKFSMDNVIEGEIEMFCEIPFCLSCKKIILTFKNEFTQIQFKENDNTRNLPLNIANLFN